MIYDDADYPADGWDRPAFLRMTDEMERGNVSAILVKDAHVKSGRLKVLNLCLTFYSQTNLITVLNKNHRHCGL